jgi:hypothetical protein
MDAGMSHRRNNLIVSERRRARQVAGLFRLTFRTRLSVRGGIRVKFGGFGQMSTDGVLVDVSAA